MEEEEKINIKPLKIASCSHLERILLDRCLDSVQAFFKALIEQCLEPL